MLFMVEKQHELATRTRKKYKKYIPLSPGPSKYLRDDAIVNFAQAIIDAMFYVCRLSWRWRFRNQTYCSYPPLQISGLIRTSSTAGSWDGDGGDVLSVQSPTNSSTATTVSGGGWVRWRGGVFGKMERVGIGNWKAKRQNYPFHRRRTNVDLKDKW